jgi:hypothetical protein
VRESRRITGDYVMTGGDYVARASFPDEIGRFSYPIDIHAMAPGDEAYGEYHEKITAMAYGRGESYGIPMRALLPKGLENVYVAGRCISADRLMQSSVRVMPGCYITGQACGVSAAIARGDGALPRQVATARLRRALKDMGGFLPDVPAAADARAARAVP